MKALVLALATGLMAGFFMPTFAADPDEPPEGMYQQHVQLLLNCFSTFGRLSEVLGDYWGETAVVLSRMSDTTTILLFVNHDRTSSTVVVSKAYKDEEEACILWSGESKPVKGPGGTMSGTSFSLNPNPIFPKKKESGTGT